MKVLTEKANLVFGAIVTALTAVFGKYWYLFAGFLIFNIIDYASGWIYAKYYAGKVSSAVGARGIIKKVSYWVIIGIAFYLSFAFRQLGKIIGINLNFMVLFGWFTLATYMINEVRSIIENLVKMGVKVPAFLTKGLDIAEKLTKDKSQEGVEK